MFSAGETVTVIRRTSSRDRTGDPTGAEVSHAIDGCAINQTESAIAGDSRSSTADGDRRTSTVTRVELLCPPGADIRAGDTVQLPGGLIYQVDGQPWKIHSPFTAWEPGVKVQLKGVADAQ